MKGTLLLFIVIAIALYTISACNKPDNNSSIRVVTIDTALQSAFYYKPGTYWIYKDSISGRVDSFAVRDTQLTSINVAGNYILNGISINVTEYNGGSTTDTSAWVINLASNYEELKWFKNLYGTEYFDFDPAFDYPFSSGPLTTVDGNTGSDNNDGVVTIFPSFILQSKAFNNVEETFHSYTTYNGIVDYYDYLFINNSEGIIKIVINDSYNNIHFTWELLRWNVVK